MFEDLAKIYKECKDLPPSELVRRFESYTLFLSYPENLSSPCYMDIMNESMVIKEIITERLKELERMKLELNMEVKNAKNIKRNIQFN